jgi:hypothetical protein
MNEAEQAPTETALQEAGARRLLAAVADLQLHKEGRLHRLSERRRQAGQHG